MTDETTPHDATIPDVAAEPAPTPEPAGTPARKGVFVPRWLAILLGIVVVAGLVGGGGFALGRASVDDDHERSAPTAPGRGGPSARPPLGDRGGSGDSTPAPKTPVGGAYLGVSVEGVSAPSGGARIVRVVPGGPAADANLEVGDVITAIDGTKVTDPSELAAAVQDLKVGDAVTITYDRDGSSTDASVRLAERPPSSSTGPAA